MCDCYANTVASAWLATIKPPAPIQKIKSETAVKIYSKYANAQMSSGFYENILIVDYTAEIEDPDVAHKLVAANPYILSFVPFPDEDKRQTEYSVPEGYTIAPDEKAVSPEDEAAYFESVKDSIVTPTEEGDLLPAGTFVPVDPAAVNRTRKIG